MKAHCLKSTPSICIFSHLVSGIVVKFLRNSVHFLEMSVVFVLCTRAGEIRLDIREFVVIIQCAIKLKGLQIKVHKEQASTKQTTKYRQPSTTTEECWCAYKYITLFRNIALLN